MVYPSYIPPPPSPPRRKRYCCAYCGTKWTQEQCRNCGAYERKEIKVKLTEPKFPPNKIVTEGGVFDFEVLVFILFLIAWASLIIFFTI